MKNKKKSKLTAIIDGPGWNFVGWQHPDIPADSSENIDFYIQRLDAVDAGNLSESWRHHSKF